MPRKSNSICALSLATTTPPFAAEIVGTKVKVSDMQRSIDFYTRIGLKTSTLYHDGTLMEMVGDRIDGAKLNLMHNYEIVRDIPDGGGFVIFMVPNVFATVKTLRDAGYSDIGDPLTTPDGSYYWLIIKDPDGNHVQLVSAQRRTRMIRPRP